MELVLESAGYAAVFIYVGVVLLYFSVIFLAPSSWYAGPAYFWRTEKIRIHSVSYSEQSASESTQHKIDRTSSKRDDGNGDLFYVMPPTTNRFAFMTLRTAPINAIQQLRGILEIARNMAAFCTSIFGFLRYMDSKDSVRTQSSITGLCGLIMQFDCFMAILCFIQASRLIYHLDFLVMVLPRRDRTQDELAAEAIGLAVGIADHTENELLRQKEARLHNTAVIVEAVSIMQASTIQDSSAHLTSSEQTPQAGGTVALPLRETDANPPPTPSMVGKEDQWSHTSGRTDNNSHDAGADSCDPPSAVVIVEQQGTPSTFQKPRSSRAELPPLATIAGHDVAVILREAEAELLRRRSRRFSLETSQLDELGRALSSPRKASPKSSPKKKRRRSTRMSRPEASSAVSASSSQHASPSTSPSRSSSTSTPAPATTTAEPSQRIQQLRTSKSEGDFPSFDSAPRLPNDSSSTPFNEGTQPEIGAEAATSSISTTVTPTSATVVPASKPMRQSSSTPALATLHAQPNVTPATGTRRRAFTVRGVTPTLDKSNDAETRSNRSHRSTSSVIIRKKKKLGKFIRSFLQPNEPGNLTSNAPPGGEAHNDVHHHHHHRYTSQHFPFGVDLSHIDKSGIAIANILAKPNQNTEGILSRLAAERGFDTIHNSTDDSASIASSFPTQREHHNSFALNNDQATAAAYATQLMTHLALEEQLSYEQHEQRLATLTKMTSGNLVIALRLMVFLFPPLMGMFHEGAMIAATAISLAMAVYMDKSVV